jgi:ribosomal protein S18 acetylase RimI-like enzyme
MDGFDLPQSEAFWRAALAAAERGERVAFVAEDAGEVVGTVQAVFAPQENQPHRGEITKMLVHRRARQRGIGEALMRAAEDAARAAGRTLLVLDTASDGAERLYGRLGWRRVGVIPGYALGPAGDLVDTVLFWKAL